MIHSRHERHSLARHGTIFWLIVLIAFFLPSNAVFASATESVGLNIAKEKSSSKDIPIEVKLWFEEAYNRADVNSAVVLYLRVAEWARVNLPQSHPTRALILRNLGMALGMTGRLGEGLKATLEAVRTYQSLAALDSSLAEELATTLDNLSVIYMRMSQWSDMIATAEEAVRIRRDRYRRNATSSNRLGKSLMNLSAFYRRLGRSQEAISTSTEAIAIFRGLAATDPTYRFHLGKTMMNLGAVYFDLGNEEGALTAMREAVSQFRTEGRNDPAAQGNLADALTNLSVISRRIGDKSQSLSYAKQSVQVYLDMTETALQSHWGDAAAALIAVSNAYVALGDTANAVPSAEASVKILRAIANYYPYRKLELAQSLNTLSILYSELGRGNDALLRGRESYQLLVELAKANPAYQETVAVALSTIGNQLLENGDAKGALRVLAESTSMSRSIAFKNPVHLRQLAGVLNTLATLHLQDGDLQQAQALFREALQIASNLSAFNPDHLVAKAQIATNFSRLYLRQAQPSAAISLLHEAVVWDVTSLQLQLPLLSERYRQGFADTFGNRWQLPFSTAQLSQAGAELALFTRLNRQGLLQDTQRNQLLLARNGAHRASLLQLVVLRSGLFNTQIPLAERQKQFAKIESLEYDLLRALPHFKPSIVAIEAIERALPVDGVLVEFQRFYPFKAEINQMAAARYLALLLKADGTIRSVDLGDASTIDAAIVRAVDLSAQQLQPEEVAAAWAKVSQLVLLPLQAELHGAKELFLSPDGELNRVPFAALPAPGAGGRLLPDLVRLRILTTGRDLLRLKQPARPGGAAAVVAAPAYGLAVPPTTHASAQVRGSRRRSAANPSEAIPWLSLPETLLEARELARLLNVAAPLTGAQATVAAVRQLKSPRILHIATHGFFWPDPGSPSTQAGARAVDDPLTRSGLVLAGANTPNASEDGLLTAAEVIGMDLDGTELVTLSACESGLGDVRSGEGVYGMQRALMAAGSRSTLLSLWKVGDQPTRAFMTAFYRRLRSGEGRADALAQTQAEFRNHPTNPLYRHVYVWGAFQLSGDWRPITGL